MDRDKTMPTKGSKLLCLGVRVAALVLCVGLFLMLMSGIWMKFIGKETMMTVKMDIENVAEKHPPCITACPLSAFKKPGMYFFT